MVVARPWQLISHLSSPSRILEMRGKHRMRDRIPRAARGKKKIGPLVGIFWLIKGKLLIDCTPLSEAERYGDFLTHPRGHAEVWDRYRRNGTVPPETEYDEPPRGRVMYNMKTRQFTLLADRCILKKKVLISQIKKQMRLPNNTEVGEDSHYRCSTCLSHLE